MTKMTRVLTAAVAAAVLLIPTTATAQPDTDGWWSETDPNGQHNWAQLERCWIDQPTPVAALPEGCADVTLRLWCDWRADYPSRLWVDRACGPIEFWPAHFGSSWWGGDTDPDHPARLWVDRLRAGGQP